LGAAYLITVYDARVEKGICNNLQSAGVETKYVGYKPFGILLERFLSCDR